MRFLPYSLFLMLTLGLGFLRAQTPADIAVQLSATAQASPARITLHWPPDANATSYTVYRKSLGTNAWGAIIGTLSGADTSFIDSTVAVGSAWEYRVSKVAAGYNGVGYCYAGLEALLVEDRGKVVLVFDTTFAQGLATEVQQLEEDLWGDGWQVVRLDVDRSDSVTGIHDRIQTIWNADPSRVRAVLLLGHVPVPYSGNLNPDGHPEHQGAWPADVYYGEMNGAWTDATVNNSNAARPQNINTIGDGKFDQTAIPSDVDLLVGRVDFANMPAFTEGEEALLRRYLAKDHAWRMGNILVADSAVIDDNFGYFGGESFASSGWRNFAPLVGSQHVYAGDFRTDLNARGHLWAYGCGGGWYQGASGVGSTGDFVGDSLQGVFAMLFGSYHGDWDSDDNFMRAALASKGTVLTCGWAGRPHWYLQSMGLGEPIGTGTRITQNNFTTYPGGFGARNVHIALMGDPTLRMHICPPPTNLQIALTNGGSAHQLDWAPAPTTVLAYHIYRQDTAGGRFWPLAVVGANITSYTDACMAAGPYRYMVRAEELRTGHTGSYHNLSQGVMGSITNAGVFAVSPDLPTPVLLCEDDSLAIPYVTTSDFCVGNVFTAELSDSAGSFSQPQVLGSVMATGDGTIMGYIPTGLSFGSGHRIRITSTTPATVGADNGIDLVIGTAPTASFIVNNVGHAGYQFIYIGEGATEFLWDFGTGDTSHSAGMTIYYFPPGDWTMTFTATNACGSTSDSYFVSISGVEDGQMQELTMSPNPARGWVDVMAEGARDGELRVVDMLGRTLHTEALGGDGRLRLSVEGWAAGIYQVEVRSRRRAWSGKLQVLE